MPLPEEGQYVRKKSLQQSHTPQHNCIVLQCSWCGHGFHAIEVELQLSQWRVMDPDYRRNEESEMSLLS